MNTFNVFECEKKLFLFFSLISGSLEMNMKEVGLNVAYEIFSSWNENGKWRNFQQKNIMGFSFSVSLCLIVHAHTAIEYDTTVNFQKAWRIEFRLNVSLLKLRMYLCKFELNFSSFENANWTKFFVIYSFSHSAVLNLENLILIPTYFRWQTSRFR